MKSKKPVRTFEDPQGRELTYMPAAGHWIVSSSDGGEEYCGYLGEEGRFADEADLFEHLWIFDYAERSA